MDELRKYVSTSALHDTSTRQGDQTTPCHPNTRRRLLEELATVLGNAENRVNWLYGPAGAGKTAIMRSLASLFAQRGQFVGGFHFWRSDPGRNTLKHFVATLAYQLTQTDPSTLPIITRALAQDSLLLEKSTKTQIEKLIIEPMLASKADRSPAESRCIIIDGLDECDEDGQREVLEVLLPSLVSQLSSCGITFFIASRPERFIDNLFTHPRLSKSTNRILLEPSPKDVREYVVAEFEEINRCHPKLKKKHGGQWPKNAQLEHLVEKSSGYFILCVTAMRHINPSTFNGRAPDQRLDDVLEAVSADPLRPLDALYLFILRQNAPKVPGLLDQWKKSVGLVCMPLDLSDVTSPWLVFGQNAASFDQEFAPVIELWHGVDTSTLEELLSGLESLLYFDEETGQPKVYHSSFPDFIFNQSRSQELHMDPAHLHRDLACLIVKTLSFSPLPNYPGLWTDGFKYHSERAYIADDILANAIDDINWPQFSQRLDLFDFRSCAVFSALDFLASVFLELQKFYGHFDVRSAAQRRQSMVAGFTPVAKKALEAIAGPGMFDKPENLHGTASAEIMVGIWQHFLVPAVEPPPMIKNLSLLHTHSTLCLQRQTFPANPSERWIFTCVGSGCLRHDSDEYQGLAESLKKYQAPSFSPNAYRIWCLLSALDLPVQPILSRFFDKGFRDRCCASLTTTGLGFEWDAPYDESVRNPSLHLFSINAIIEYIDHSTPTQLLLDMLWETFFLHDGGQTFRQLKYYANDGGTRTEAENPIYSRATRLTLAYFNRCLQSGICPTIRTEIPIFTVNLEDDPFNQVHTLIPVPLSETQQKEMWSKYSSLVTYVPPTLPVDPQHAAAPKSQPFVNDAVVSDRQSRSVQKPDKAAEVSPPLQPTPQDVSGLVDKAAAGTEKKRKSLWRRLLCS